jgi:hypothetical protein
MDEEEIGNREFASFCKIILTIGEFLCIFLGRKAFLQKFEIRSEMLTIWGTGGI